jgi:hypothetical protein
VPLPFILNEAADREQLNVFILEHKERLWVIACKDIKPGKQVSPPFHA